MRFLTFILLAILFMAGWQDINYSNPEEVFEVYKKALSEIDIQTYMSCITYDSHQMLKTRPPQAPRMRREYEDISNKTYKVTVDNATAILEFKPQSEIAPPYLFKKEDGKWKIDLKRMSEEIVFDEKNHWRWR